MIVATSRLDFAFRQEDQDLIVIAPLPTIQNLYDLIVCGQ